MRLGELIIDAQLKSRPEKITWEEAARRAKGKPTAASFSRLSQEPRPDQLGEHPKVRRTDWGTISTMDAAPDTRTMIGVAWGLHLPPRTVGMAVLESLGLPDVFSGGLDEAVALLYPGWVDLDAIRRNRLRALSADLVLERERELELEEARARIAELEAENEALTEAARTRRRR